MLSRTKSGLIFYLVIGLWGGPFAWGQMVRYDDHKVVQIDVRTQQQLDLLEAMNLDFWSHEIGIGPIDVRVSPEQLAAMDKAGLAYTVRVSDVQALIELEAMGGHPEGTFFSDYRTYDEVNTFLNGLVAQRPDLVSMVNFGLSLEGRTMWGVRITGPGGSDKPEVFYHSCQHAREWVTVPLINYVAQQLVDNYGVDPDVTELVNRVEWYLLPISNPDGYVYTWTGDRLWRKNRRNNGDGTFGVDLNRNWGYQWGGEGSSGDPASETYRGTAPFSEPETQRMRDFTVAHPDILGHLDYHSYSQLHLWPWGWTPQLPPDQPTFALVGNRYVEIVESVHGEVYVPGPIYTTIYPVSGGSVDWMYGDQGILSFTTELRPTGSNPGFLLPPDQIIPTCEENTPALLWMTDWITAALRMSLPNGLPSALTPDVDNHITVKIEPNTDTLAPNGAIVYYRVGADGSFNSTVMTPLGNDLYDAILPARGCGNPTEYYFSATSVGGSVVTLPEDAPASFFSTPVGTFTEVFHDNYETDLGWTVQSVNLTAGEWIRVDPNGTSSGGQPVQPEDDNPAGTGTLCFVTGQGTPGGSVGQADVDGGPTHLISPTFDLTGADATIRYYLWYYTNGNDPFTVAVSNDNGASWVDVVVFGHSPGWNQYSFRVSDYVTPTATVKVRFTAIDNPNNSITEAAVDDLGIEVFDCQGAGPCGDFDGDGDVDLSDFTQFQLCFGGSNNPPAPTCPPGVDADCDGDGDVDLADFLIFQQNFTGSL